MLNIFGGLPTVNNKNTILTYEYTREGKIKFLVGEIINKETGEYRILRTGLTKQLIPFNGYCKELGIDFNTIKRSDNIVCTTKTYTYPQQLPHTNNDITYFVYSIRELFCCLNNNRRNIYVSEPLEFAEYNCKPGEKKPLRLFTHDSLELLSWPDSNIESWLEFEDKFNKTFQHFLHTGKHWLEEEARFIVPEIKKATAKIEKNKQEKQNSKQGAEM